MNLGVTGEAAPNAASSSVARYSARGASRVFLEFLRVPILAWNRALLVGVGGDEARIDREPLGPDQALRHAALNDALKQMTQRIARQSGHAGSEKVE